MLVLAGIYLILGYDSEENEFISRFFLFLSNRCCSAAWEQKMRDTANQPIPIATGTVIGTTMGTGTVIGTTMGTDLTNGTTVVAQIITYSLKHKGAAASAAVSSFILLEF